MLSGIDNLQLSMVKTGLILQLIARRCARRTCYAARREWRPLTRLLRRWALGSVLANFAA